jgi:hypothetical protein
MYALVDDRRYFDRIAQYYRMFSFDCAYNAEGILIEPAKIARISTQSFSSLLQALIQFGQRGEKSFLIATHGNPLGLPIRIRTSNAATINSDMMDSLTRALDGDAGTRQAGRDFAMSYAANGARVFQSTQQLDELLNLLRRVRGIRLERLEFRGCNIGAGSALRSIHRLLGAQITAGPTVQFIWTRLSTATYRSTSAVQFAEQLARLPPARRTFTRVDCYRGSSPDNDNVVAIGIDGETIRLIARSQDDIKGWTQAYLQQSILFAMGQEPPGGGYRPGGYLPIVGFLTPNGRFPFVVPGDIFNYTEYLTFEMQPPQWIP